MRMRKKKHGAERMSACSDILIQDGNSLDKYPVELEIGCGKGAFICGCAERNPDTGYVAMEKISDVLLLAAEKTMTKRLTNIKFLVGNAMNLKELFPAHSVSRIYLNFSDPWPKKGYAKRRLTHSDFLNLYKEILTENGEICLKTDNEGLFDFSLEEFTACGFKLRELTRDLHNSEYSKDNIITEYEKNFSEKGFPIHRVVAYL